jgi:hypothetical protein
MKAMLLSILALCAVAIAQDTDPPYVDGVYPEDGEYDIYDNIVFHCIDDQSAVEIDSIVFTLEDDTLGGGSAAGVPISPTVILPGDLDIDDTDPLDVICTFDPEDPLAMDRWYTATVDGCLADIWGNEMGEDFVWEFGGGDVEESSWGEVKARGW